MSIPTACVTRWPCGLANGAGLHHIKRYLGHLSIRMAEHYAKVAVSEIEDVLQ